MIVVVGRVRTDAGRRGGAHPDRAGRRGGVARRRRGASPTGSTRTPSASTSSCSSRSGATSEALAGGASPRRTSGRSCGRSRTPSWPRPTCRFHTVASTMDLEDVRDEGRRLPERRARGRRAARARARARARCGSTVLRCGICGSDLHARHGLDDWADLAARGRLRPLRPLRPSRSSSATSSRGEVAEYGPGCRRERRRPGTPVVALPLAPRRRAASTPVGLSAHAPGAYAEQLLVQESLMLPVPERPGARRRGADRADGRRLARRAPRRGRQAARWRS